MTEIHQFKSALDTFEYTNGVYNYTIAPGVWTYIDVDELNFEHLVDIVSKTHGIKIYVANQENFFKKFEIEIGANLGATVSVEDSLISSSTTSALSANQGRMLDAAISNKLDASLYNEYYKGVYSTSGALDIAHPTAISGSYAMVDTGIGSNAQLYWYDVQDGWVTGGGATLSNTDALLEGSTNKYFTEARVRSTLLNGLTTATNVAITSSDSVLGGMGKLQAQINVLLLPTVNTYSATTSYTLQTVDNDGRTYLRMDNAASNTVTVPSTQTKPISIRQAGTGTTTLQAGSGVTLNGTLAFTAQHQTKTVIPLGSGIYDVVG